MSAVLRCRVAVVPANLTIFCDEARRSKGSLHEKEVVYKEEYDGERECKVIKEAMQHQNFKDFFYKQNECE
jgi:hypothetical protein